MRQYLDLVRHVLATGTRKENRTGVDTISTFGYYYEHDLREGFPLLTTKKMPWRSIVVELLWFLSGSNESEFLERHGVTFWRPWYNPNGTVNAAYGPAWRQFMFPDLPGDAGVGYNDQIKWVVGQLKEKPMRRDLVVSAWQPHIAQIPPTTKTYWAPCHCMFVLNVQNEDYSTIDHEEPWEAMDSSYQDTTLLGVVWAKTETEAYEKALAQFGPQYEKLPDGEQMDCLHVRRPMESRLAGYRKERLDSRGPFAHYGHNDGTVPVCGEYNGWPCVQGLRSNLKWCPKCQKILQGIHGSDKFQNPSEHECQPTKRLCLHLTQRSCDTILGVPFNLASYALLTHLLARFAGLEPGIFGHSLVDAHIYTSKPDGSKAEFDHVPGAREQLTREPYYLPKLILSDDIRGLEDVEKLLHPSVTTAEIMAKLQLQGYASHPKMEFKVAV